MIKHLPGRTIRNDNIFKKSFILNEFLKSQRISVVQNPVKGEKIINNLLSNMIPQFFLYTT